MKTRHQFCFSSAESMPLVSSESVDLIVTSPPYPMIRMWDEMFSEGRPEIQDALKQEHGNTAFELMHQVLDPVWKECMRVLKPGGIACINIGDAVRTVDGDFRLYPNHARILQAALEAGFSALPPILWRKQTNAPNKFMGSGMMPPGAYVTLEHEYVLVLRKGAKRQFNRPMEKQNRLESAYFWEERNIWFSDVWTDLKGTVQKMVDPLVRQRSGAFPFELPYRLINMFSVKGDTVLDPFLGTGTTAAAAMAAARNSIGYERNPELRRAVLDRTRDIVSFANTRIRERIEQHAAFVRERVAGKGPLKHRNVHYGFPVTTKQETHLMIPPLESCRVLDRDTVEVAYTDQQERIQMELFNG
ncbi:site-specific DNA-methyltransferase [Desulfococcus sp.]|uniref:DNA-methyltransferase n=1 Tax=Desulfococcus sp. TaxID=2025834 RepID=UPI0035933E86